MRNPSRVHKKIGNICTLGRCHRCSTFRLNGRRRPTNTVRHLRDTVGFGLVIRQGSPRHTKRLHIGRRRRCNKDIRSIAQIGSRGIRVAIATASGENAARNDQKSCHQNLCHVRHLRPTFLTSKFSHKKTKSQVTNFVVTSCRRSRRSRRTPRACRRPYSRANTSRRSCRSHRTSRRLLG